MPKGASRATAKRSPRKPSRHKPSGLKSSPKQAARKIARKRTGMAGRRAAELERYRLALESMNLNTYDWDIANNVVYISPAMRETVGFGPDQPFSLENWHDFIHPEDQPLYRAALVSLLKGESCSARRAARRCRAAPSRSCSPAA
jgi:PAS domain-containing protein